MSYNNILLIADDENIVNSVLNKLVLLRENDKITVCSIKDAKKIFDNSVYSVVILQENQEKDTLKLIGQLLDINPNAKLILYLNNKQPEFILKAYDNGIYDYITEDTQSWELLIKIVNGLKAFTLYKELEINKKFLNQFEAIDVKTGLYKYKYLKEIFRELNEDIRIQNGVLIVLTLDEKIKTKVSINRLAIAIKNSTRRDDVVAIARGGIFYLVAANVDMIGAKGIVKKIQEKMTNSCPIRSGMAKIGIQTFEELDKNAKDSLLSAIQNEETYASLTDNIDSGNTWLDKEEHRKNKNYKLFESAYKNKLEKVITPVFFRFQKECENKLIGTQVIQYTNKIESVFCLKNKHSHSELTVHFNGYAKLNIEITHKGLDSPENSKLELPLNKLTDKELLKLLKQLKSEYKESLRT